MPGEPARDPADRFWQLVMASLEDWDPEFISRFKVRSVPLYLAKYPDLTGERLLRIADEAQREYFAGVEASHDMAEEELSR